MELVNARTRKGERLAHLNVMCGREMTEVGHAYAGDIVVVPKLSAETGDTLSVTGKVEAAAFKFPNSQYRIAIEAENRSEEDKLFTFIDKACELDPTMSIDRDEETRPDHHLGRRRGARSRSCSTAWRSAPRSRRISSRCASRTARPSAASPPRRGAIRSRPAAPGSSATASCAWSRCSMARSTSSWTRSWAAASRAR